MSTLLQKLKKFFSINYTASDNLETYIISKNPQTIADVEQLAQQYLNRVMCRRTL